MRLLLMRYLFISLSVALAGLILLVSFQQNRLNACHADNQAFKQAIDFQNQAIENFKAEQDYYQQKINQLDEEYNKARQYAFSHLSEDKKLDVYATCKEAIAWAVNEGVKINAAY